MSRCGMSSALWVSRKKPFFEPRWQKRGGWDAAADFAFDPHATLVRSQLTRPKVSDRAK